MSNFAMNAYYNSIHVNVLTFTKFKEGCGFHVGRRMVDKIDLIIRVI